MVRASNEAETTAMVSPAPIPVASLINHGGVHDEKPSPAMMARQRPMMKDRVFLSCSATALDRISRVDLDSIIIPDGLIREYSEDVC